MASEWLTVSEIANKTGIANSTCRRYLQNFNEFFMTKGGGRVKKYEEIAVKIVIQIKQLYDEGLETAEIHSRLKADFAMVVDGDKPLVINGEESQVLATKEDIAEVKQEVAEMKQLQAELIQELRKRDEYIKESLERRDRQLMESLNAAVEAKKMQLETEATKEKSKAGFFARIFGAK